MAGVVWEGGVEVATLHHIVIEAGKPTSTVDRACSGMKVLRVNLIFEISIQTDASEFRWLRVAPAPVLL